MGTTALFHPAPVLPDKAGVVEQQYFSQIQELFFDPPVEMHENLPQKNPRTESNLGMSLFYPQDPGKASARQGGFPGFRQVF
jgi:hypothetical protein